MTIESDFRMGHAGFDLEMELLASLSPRPARRQDLTRDLGVSKEDLEDLLDGLRDRGFKLASARSDVAERRTSLAARLRPGVHVWVEAEGWPAARAAGQKYWDELYRRL